MKNEKSDNQKYQITELGRVILISFGIIVILTAATLVLLFRNDIIEVYTFRQPLPGAGIAGENIAPIQREAEQKVDRGMFETHMNTTWVFPNGSSPSANAVMGNSPSNNFPFWFTVTLHETGETVLTSEILPVGTEMSEIILDTALPSGEYPAVVHFNMIDEAGIIIDGNMGINITLKIIH